MSIDLTIFENFLVIPIIVLCFILGFVIKNYIKIPNKYIPLIMLLVGIIANVIITCTNGETVTLTTFLGGATSGLASTGSYELIVNTFNLKDSNKKNE